MKYHPSIQGCPRKLGSMVSKWVIVPIYIYPICKQVTTQFYMTSWLAGAGCVLCSSPGNEFYISHLWHRGVSSSKLYIYIYISNGRGQGKLGKNDKWYLNKFTDCSMAVYIVCASFLCGGVMKHRKIHLFQNPTWWMLHCHARSPKGSNPCPGLIDSCDTGSPGWNPKH